MTEKEQAFVDKWSKTKAKGKTRYMVIVTLVFIIAFPLITYLLEQVWPSIEGGYNSKELIKNLIVGVLLGVFLSFRNWRANEKRWEKLKEDN